MEPYTHPLVGTILGYKEIVNILTPYINTEKRRNIYATPERTIIFEVDSLVNEADKGLLSGLGVFPINDYNYELRT